MNERKAVRMMQGSREGDEVESRKHLQVGPRADGRLDPPLSSLTCTYMGPVNLSCSHKAIVRIPLRHSSGPVGNGLSQPSLD